MALANQIFVLIVIGLLLQLIACSPDDPSIGSSKPFFRSVPQEESGIDFKNALQEKERQNILNFPYHYNGGGVAVGDLNQDDLPDVYFTGNMAGDRLYLNKGGLQFEDVTTKAGVLKSNLWTTGVSFVDINNDGWLDIYVCRSGTGNFRNNLLYINQENGRFQEMAKAYGLNDNGYSVQSYFFDYDLDGDLDLYLVNHSMRFFAGQEALFKIKNQPGPDEADKLYQNNGDGTFQDVSKTAGIQHFAFGLSAAIADYNQDGYPDIYAASDFFEPDFLYINQGDGTFSNRLSEMIGHSSLSSMGTDAADFNNDGLQDLVVCDMQAKDNYRKKANMASMDVERFRRIVREGYHYQYMQNTLQLNSGRERFSEVAELAGVSETDWSWAPLFFDADNDGWKDLFVSNGIRRDIQYKDVMIELEKKGLAPSQAKPMNIIESFPVHKMKNYLYQNRKDLTFLDQTDAWGLDFAGFSTGAAYADLDKDGDLDLILNNIDDPASVFENLAHTTSPFGNYLQIRLIGLEDNKYGIGSTVKIKVGDQAQYQYLQPSRGFQSSVEPILHFGLGNDEQIDEITVTWPNGKVSFLQNIPANQRIEIGQENLIIPETPKPTKLIFANTNTRLKHLHRDQPFDDFSKEILLPHKYSQLGPGMASADVNADGLDDIFIGGAKDYPGRLYLQNQKGDFVAKSNPVWTRHQAYEDIGTHFFDADQDGDQDLVVSSGSNEWENTSSMYQDRLYLNDGKGNFAYNANALPKSQISSGVIRSCDFDMDGDLDLFIAGRQMPGQYPLPTSSMILRNNGGTFVDVSKEIAPELIEIGMVTDVLWTDVDQDQDKDLILVGEWMPITILEQKNGQFSKFQSESLDQTSGWWYALDGEDFDQDGDIDFVAGNLGLNYKYQATVTEPFQVYANDFDKNGTLDIVLGYFNNGELFPLRGKQCSSEQMPALKEQFNTYSEFASSSLVEIYGTEPLSNAKQYEANTFASVYIENLGDGKFEWKPFPNLAQVSSINDFLIEDFNRDGHLDILMAGNMYNSEVETARNDAGLGLLLTGNGKGDFQPIPTPESGFLAPGDVKSLLKIETSKGASLLFVGNNNDELQVFEVN